MKNMTEIKHVSEQYSNDKNLSARIGLHEKYSTNPVSFMDWLFSIYEFKENIKILELGCGNGFQWDNHLDYLKDNTELILSDYSLGMVETVQKKFSSYPFISFKQIDIQNITFEDETFDIVIANHMLYHIPDLDQALKEVSRVLKKDGTFYASTNGNYGIRSYLHEALAKFDSRTNAYTGDYSFSLQNGKEVLSKYFTQIERIDHEDSLAITVVEDLMSWVESTIGIFDFSDDFVGISNYFKDLLSKEGVILIPKEGGVFISKK